VLFSDRGGHRHEAVAGHILRNWQSYFSSESNSLIFSVTGGTLKPC